MKKNVKIILISMMVLAIPLGLLGCEEEPEYERYTYRYFDTFDTVTDVVGFAESEEAFNEYAEYIENRMQELHRIFDRFTEYEGINNIRTINDHAGESPVEVDQEILDLIQFSKDWYEPTQGKMNIAIGPVSTIWSRYREDAEFDPASAEIPPMEELEAAAEYVDIDKIVVDHENGTVFLEDSNMILDVGAVAKGYAVEIVVQEVIEQGFTSGIVSVGGNVRTFGKPLDGVRDRWGVGIRDPDGPAFGGESIDTVFLNDASVVSSGDYQRYYIVDGEVMHHLIDPDTLMPGNYYSAVTVITQDSGLADYLSTAVFLLPFEESLALVESLDDVEAFWVMKDGEVEFSPGLEDKLRSQGASGADN
jgi:FAD:protein FMN transferase